MPQPFSCFIIGAGTLPIQCAEIILQDGHDLRGLISADPALRDWALTHKITLLDPADVIAALKQQPFDYLFSIVNDHILPPEALEAPRHWAINYHDGPLPKYAGSYVTSWAILQREPRHGITWHLMTEQVDAGDILKQTPVAIEATDTALSLNVKCYDAAIRAFAQLVTDLAADRAAPIAQNLAERTFFARHRRPPAACLIDWSQPAVDIDALARALHFGAYPNPLGRPKLLIGEDTWVAADVALNPTETDAPPGTITALSETALTIATAEGQIDLRGVASLRGQAMPLSDWAARYDLRRGSRLPVLSPSLAQRLTEVNEAVASSEKFWLSRLATCHPVTLPLAARRSTEQADGYDDLTLSLADGSSDILLAAFVSYLARLNDLYRFDVAVSYPDLRQIVAGAETIFADHVPLRVEINLDQTSTAVQATLRAELEKLKKRQTYARDLVARDPELARQPDRVLPIAIEVSDSLETLQPIPGSHLTLGIAADGSACRWLYNSAIFTPEDVGRLAHHFTTFVQSFQAEPEQSVAALPLLTAGEREQILVEWNGTETLYPHDQCLIDIFERQAAETPQATALVCGERRLTYRALDRQANQLAHYLRRRGVGPNVLVGICLERSVEMVVGLLGILKTGGAYVPLDPAFPSDRLKFMVEDAALSVLVTQTSVAPPFVDAVAEVVVLDAEQAAIAQEDEIPPPRATSPQDLAYVIYTSGSTGRPKGVQIGQQALVNFLWTMRDEPGFTAQDVLVAITTLSFDIAALELYLPLISGGQVVLATQEEATDGQKLAALLARSGATVMQATPATWRMLLLAGWTGQPNLRMLCGGEALPEALAAQLLARGQALWNLYGPTETTIWSSLCRVEAADPTAEGWVSIGRPLANTALYVLDSQRQPLPIGVPGELYIGGAGLAHGYLNRPELTADRFVPHPFKAGERLYKTGDVVRYRPDGSLDYLGRSDHQVKLRGYRIELGEIEGALAQHSAVRQAVVLLWEERLVAYIVPQTGLRVTGGDLRAHLSQNLPDYMIPAAFVSLEQLPLTPNKKIDRQALPAPTPDRADVAADFIPPRDPVEEILAQMWNHLLGVSQIGIHDNFFELGGHSLLATQLITRLQKTLRVAPPLRLLFESPTIAEFAGALRREESEPGQLLATARLRQKLERMSPEEREALLRRKKEKKEKMR